MIYEVQVSYTKIDDNGNDKNVKESIVIKEASCFADAEEQAYEAYQGYSYTDIDVCAVKRSKIKEIANRWQENGDLLWIAEMQDVFHDNDGNEKKIKYKILFFSKTYESANAFITEYAKQGYDLSLVSLKLTKFVCVVI